MSPHTIRRDLDELAEAGRLVRVHGGALARSSTATTYEGRRAQGAEAKRQLARAAVALLRPGQVAILDGGSTALALADAIPPDHTGTFVTHSPPVAAALGRHPGLEVVVIGGRLEPRAMVAVGAQTVAAYRQIAADICFLGVWSIHAEHGVSRRIPKKRRSDGHCSSARTGSSASRTQASSARSRRSSSAPRMRSPTWRRSATRRRGWWRRSANWGSESSNDASAGRGRDCACPPSPIASSNDPAAAVCRHAVRPQA